MSTNEPTIVKLDSTAAFLAFLPTLSATPVRNSLVIAPFSGRFASRALRIGVDSIATGGTAQKLASAAVGVLARLEDCDYVAVVLYRDEPFDEVCRNWLPALDTVMKRLHESGYHFKDAAIVAADGWMPYFEGDPSTPMPLSDIAAAAENMPTDEHDRRELRLPATDPDLARRVTEILIDLTIDGSESDAFGRLHRTTPPDPIDLLERALTAPSETASALTLARLIHQIDTEGAVDRTVLQIAFGRDQGAQSWSNTLVLRAAAARVGREPYELLLDEYERGIEDDEVMRMADLLAGRTSEVPSVERMRAGLALLGRAISSCPLPERAWTMCVFAWLQWAMGASSAAHETLASVRRVAPRNSFAPLWDRYIARALPEWIFDGNRPSQPNRAARRRAAKNRS